MTTLQHAMAKLDEKLTGHPARKCEHMASGQHATVDAWYFDSEHAWYLSDGGYSRVMIGESGSLYLSNVSLPAVVNRWDAAIDERRIIEVLIKQWLA